MSSSTITCMFFRRKRGTLKTMRLDSKLGRKYKKMYADNELKLRDAILWIR